jgi:hypothetical protein
MTAKAKDVMTPAHPRWEEFSERLSGPEGCNFRRKPDGSSTWTCKAGADKTMATKILKAMGMDVAASLTYFEAHGGYCDCEILFNVEATHPGPVCRAAGQAAAPACPIPLASERSRGMSKEIKVGQSYRCKIGRNSVEVTVLNTCDGGWEVATISGKRLTIKAATRLSALTAATTEGAKVTAGRNVGQQGASQGEGKRMSLMDAAAKVLQEADQADLPMNTTRMVEIAMSKAYWQPKKGGKTPANTLYVMILRDQQKHGGQARFRRAEEKGKFFLQR